MSYDPRQLILVLDEIESAIARWTTTFASIEEAARNVSVDAVKLTERVSLDAIQSEEIAAASFQLANEALGKATEIRERSFAARDEAASAAVTSQEAVNAADFSMGAWREGLARAQRILSDAEGQLDRALHSLAIARTRLTNAIAEHSYAVAAYNSCRNSYTVDNQGNRHYRDCGLEAARVNNAAASVSMAQQQVVMAQAAVAAAEREVERARALVTSCQRGLSDATDILTEAKATWSEGQSAVNFARQSLSWSEDALMKANAAVAQAQQIMSLAGSAIAEADRAVERRGHHRGLRQAGSRQARRADRSQPARPQRASQGGRRVTQLRHSTALVKVMNWSFQLGLIHRNILETSAVFRHQSRYAEDLYGEASHIWRDRRGAAFALGFLEPQLQLVAPVTASLAELSSNVGEAGRFTETAEAKIRACSGRNGRYRTRRRSIVARHNARQSFRCGRAWPGAKSHAVRRDLQRRVALLGGPPV